MSEAPPEPRSRATSKATVEPGPDDWAASFLRLLETEAGARLGERMVVVPDGNTAYALQRLCVSPDQVACRCLTARYVIPEGPALGTMLAAFAGDMETVHGRQRDTRGDLVDQTQGTHWADFASRMTSSSLWPDLINEQLPLAISVGQFALDGPTGLLSIIGALGADPSSSNGEPASLLRDDERLVLLLDSDKATSDLTQLANALPRGVLLVVTSPPDRDLDWLTELIGPVMRLRRYEGAPPSSGRITYDDSALESDQPAEVDALGMDGLALTTAKLLVHEGTGPICIGVEAPWGKGKSSFLKLVRTQAKRLAESNPGGFKLLPVDFNAWVYSNAEQAWAGLAVEVIEAVETELSRWHRLTLRWRYAWKHRRGLLVGALITAALAIGLAVMAAALAGWNVASDSVQNPLALTFAAVSPAVVGLIVLVGAAHRLTRPISQRVHEYLARPDHAVRRGYQNAVVDDLKFSLAELRRRHPKTRVVVMVDDLDRCAEDKVVEILQAINVVLAQSKVYTLLAIDGEMVRRAVFRHYRDDAETELPPEYQLAEDFPYEYLEKIVQFSIRLPPTSEANRSAYVRGLFKVPTQPEPASSTAPGPHPQRPDVTVQGLGIDLSQVAQPTVGVITDLPMADTPAEAEAMARYHALLDDNAREIKRAVNVHRFVKIAMYRTESPPTEEVQRRLVLWVVLCLAAPRKMSEVLTDPDLATKHDDLLKFFPRVSRRLDPGSALDQLPVSDLPLLVAAANLIQLVGPPGRDGGSIFE